jgi:hypothetical protein
LAQEQARKKAAKVATGSKTMPDDAHHGDIRGAFGTIGEHDPSGARGLRRRLLAFAVIIGPGLIVMVGDNDAGGVSTYAAAGQNYGASLLWVLLLLIPVLIVNQEMVVRLGAVSGVGHGRLIFERFGKIWGRFAVSDLFVRSRRSSSAYRLVLNTSEFLPGWPCRSLDCCLSASP